MKHNATIIVLSLLLTVHPAFSWEWPLWLLTSRVGHLFMDKDQKYFYRTVLALKECESTPIKDSNKVINSRRAHYINRLKNLCNKNPVDHTDEYKKEALVRNKQYAIHGHVLKYAMEGDKFEVQKGRVAIVNDSASSHKIWGCPR